MKKYDDTTRASRLWLVSILQGDAIGESRHSLLSTHVHVLQGYSSVSRTKKMLSNIIVPFNL